MMTLFQEVVIDLMVVIVAAGGLVVAADGHPLLACGFAAFCFFGVGRILKSFEEKK